MKGDPKPRNKEMNQRSSLLFKNSSHTLGGLFSSKFVKEFKSGNMIENQYFFLTLHFQLILRPAVAH